MAEHANDSRLTWTSGKGRQRVVRIVTRLKVAADSYIVRVERGLSGEDGRCFTVPGRRLA